MESEVGWQDCVIPPNIYQLIFKNLNTAWNLAMRFES